LFIKLDQFQLLLQRLLSLCHCRIDIDLYPVYTMKQTSSKHRASSSSQLHRVNWVLCTVGEKNMPPPTKRLSAYLC